MLINDTFESELLDLSLLFCSCGCERSCTLDLICNFSCSPLQSLQNSATQFLVCEIVPCDYDFVSRVGTARNGWGSEGGNLMLVGEADPLLLPGSIIQPGRNVLVSEHPLRKGCGVFVWLNALVYMVSAGSCYMATQVCTDNDAIKSAVKHRRDSSVHADGHKTETLSNCFFNEIDDIFRQVSRFLLNTTAVPSWTIVGMKSIVSVAAGPGSTWSFSAIPYLHVASPSSQSLCTLFKPKFE